MNVQETWNSIENVIIDTVDQLAPIKMYPVNPQHKNPNIPWSVKQKLNKRNRLLKQKLDSRHEPQIKLLTSEIKDYFRSKKVSKVKGMISGSKNNI